MLLRLLYVVDILLLLPMMAIGMMMGFSGGGHTPIFQKIGARMLVYSAPVAIASVILAEIIWQVGIGPLACMVALIPLAFWGYNIIRVRYHHLFPEEEKKSEQPDNTGR